VAVRADQRLAWNAETLLMDRVTDAVAGRAEPDTELAAGALQEQVIVGVLEVFLERL
jgi:hypothetical protein